METFYTSDRNEWRAWLAEHYKDSSEIWFVFPTKDSDEASLAYNDAVEEALCFGWIDGTAKRIDDTHQGRRFTPRRKGSPYSQPNIERLKWLDTQDMLLPEIRQEVLDLIDSDYAFPEDIIAKLREDEAVWDNYQGFSDSYKRIRIAYIDAARSRPEEFDKRLANFIDKTRKGKLIKGYGGVEKYYK